jgi:hypothetical protein
MILNFQDAKQAIKYLLKKTSFKRLCSLEQKLQVTDQQSQHYYNVEFETSDPDFSGYMRLLINLDPQSLNVEEVKQKDDELLIPVPRLLGFKFED